jgi:hypothetical protein
MSFGRLLGAAGGFLLGGPAGAALGMGIGGAAEEALGGGETGAIRDAAAQQSAATDRAIDLQREMFERQIGLQEPWRQSGIAAQNRLLTLLGINPTPPSGGGGIFGTIANAVQPRTGLSVDPNDPNFGRYAKEFGMQQFQADPGYAFRLSEGMKALERSAAARGGLVSGATMKGIQRYGQDLASQEYGNAFNRYRLEREAALNPLQSLAGVGQTTSQQLGQAGTMYGQNVGNAMIGQGTNQANSLLAAQRARSSTYGQLGNVLGRYLNTPTVGGFNNAGINPASGEYYGSLEF